MKSKITCLFLLLAAPLLHAQATPSLMSYQGRVTDAAGVLIGNTTPANRTVTFKLYSASSGGAALYAEVQTVTISGGEFSVLIGNGTGLSGSPGPGSPATTPYKTLGDIVNSGAYTSLYLGVTVDDGTAAADAEIAPRQQMVSGAFALRAKVAETVAGGAVTTTMLGDGQVSTAKIASGAVDSSRILDGSIAATDIANSTITSAKLDTTTIGLWTPVGTSVYRNNNVGIGEANPGFPLNFASTTGEKISLFGNGGNHFGFGIQPGMLQIFGGTSGDAISFGYGSSGAFTETMRVQGNGNVGIGTNNPGEKLVVSGGCLRVTSTNNPYMVVSTASNQGVLAIATTAGAWSTSAATNDVVLRSDSYKLVLQSGGGAAGLVIDTSNNVGIGTAAPVSRLHLSEATGTLATCNSGSLTLEHGNIGGASSIVFRSRNNGSSDFGYIQYQDDSTIGGTAETSRLIIGNQNDADDNVILAPSGKVGIGTMNPLAPLHVAGSVQLAFYLEAYVDTNGAGDAKNQYHTDLAHGIIADSGVRAARFDVVSDARVKEVIGVSDSARDLAVLQSIEITDYSFKDKVAMGKQVQKRVIAQQVESVYPNAVKVDRGVVPDIYQKSTIEEGWVKLATDLKVGERVRLIGGAKEAILEVLEVRADGFRTHFTSADGKVFVYGREVSDLRSVDYDAIAMLNVSATQQLKKDSDAAIVALQAKNAALEARLSALEKLLPAAK